MPLYDFLCLDCGHLFEELTSWDSINRCSNCQSDHLDRLPPRIGGYQGDMGSASTRPKGAGSPKRGKK